MGACESLRLSNCVLVQPDGWARGEREGYGEPRDVTSLSLSALLDIVPGPYPSAEPPMNRPRATPLPRAPPTRKLGNRRLREHNSVRDYSAAAASPSSATSSTGGFCMTQSV